LLIRWTQSAVFEGNSSDTYREDFDDKCLGKPEKEKECQEDNEVAAPEIIRIKIVANLEIVFSRDYITSRLSAV
jgi:hypothetical protein